MNEQAQIQGGGDSSPIDILIFVKASGKNIVKYTIICLIVGVIYYFSVPTLYLASVRIELAKIDGNYPDNASNVIEKMKLPHYFSTTTLKACDSDGDLESHAKFFERIKPSKSKFSETVNFATKAQSPQLAKDCLNAVIDEVTRKQNPILESVLVLRKKKIQELSEQLEITENFINTFPAPKGENNPRTSSFYHHVSHQIHTLKQQISDLKRYLHEPYTHNVSIVAPVYSSEVPINKQPLFTLGLCLSLGVFLGMLVTWVMRVVPGIWQQLREGESRAG
jgi:hypothetical protein